MGAHQGGRKPLEWVDEGTRALGLRGMRDKGAMMRQVSTKKPRTPKIKRANKRCELGHSALKTVEQTRFAPEEARCVECVKIRRGEWCCRRRYDVRTRKEIETTDVYAGKGWWAHISQSI